MKKLFAGLLVVSALSSPALAQSQDTLDHANHYARCAGFLQTLTNAMRRDNTPAMGP